MFVLRVLVAGLLSLAAVESQNVILPGTCPVAVPQPGFDPTTFFQGTFLELANVRNEVQQNYNCERDTYTWNPVTNVIDVLNQGVTIGTNTVNSAIGTADCTGATCQLQFLPDPAFTYVVIDSGFAYNTDYAIVTSCTQIGSEYLLLGYIIAEKKLPPPFLNSLRDTMAASLNLVTPAEKALIELTYQNPGICNQAYNP